MRNNVHKNYFSIKIDPDLFSILNRSFSILMYFCFSMGGENAVLHASDFGGVTPRRSPAMVLAFG